MRTYAVGDIHGQIDKLRDVHAWITEDRARMDDDDAPIVHVGDFVDRGVDVRATLDYLIEGQRSGRPWVFLKGNHDRMMAAFLQRPEQRDPYRPDLHWLQANIGGRESLASYGVDVSLLRDEVAIHAEGVGKVPIAHVEFLATLPSSFERGGAYFCHAGIRPGVPLSQQVEDDLVWIRREFHESTADHGALIVHGHTPVDKVTHYGNRLNIDTGAAFGRALSAVVIEGDAVFQITADGRRSLGR